MAVIFIPDTVRIVVRGQGTSGQELLHTLHAVNPGGAPDYTFCLGVANVVSQWCTNFYRHMWASGIAMRDVVVTGADRPNPAQAQVPNLSAGDRAGIGLPSQITLRLKYGTNQAGRRHEGGVSLWPAVENDYLDEDRFQPAYVAAGIAVMTQLLANLNANGSPQAIGSYTTPAAYPIMRVLAVDDLLDSRRRRTNGRGP